MVPLAGCLATTLFRGGVRTASDKQDIEQINHKSEIINHKFIKNGQLLIERNGKTYNTHGAPIE